MMNDNVQDTAYRVAYTREKLARLEAERLLEERSRELYQRNCELEASYAALKEQQALALYHEKMATLGVLASGLAHQMNSPLASVLSNIHSLAHPLAMTPELLRWNQRLLEAGVLPAEWQRALAERVSDCDLPFIAQELPQTLLEIDSGIQRIVTIVRGLTRFSRHAGDTREQADLVEMLKEALALLDEERPARLQVSFNLPASAPVYCVPVTLSQVFLSLLLNAFQALNETASPAVELSVIYRDSSWVVRIADNGCGIAEAHLTEIFLPFFTTKSKAHAIGMGLAIAQRILNEHGGVLRVQSVEGEGAIFEVELPDATA